MYDLICSRNTASYFYYVIVYYLLDMHLFQLVYGQFSYEPRILSFGTCQKAVFIFILVQKDTAFIGDLALIRGNAVTLGMTIDYDLMFDRHFSEPCKNANKKVNALLSQEKTF